MKTSNRILLTSLAVIIVFMTAVAIIFKTKTKDLFIEGDGNIITQEQTFEPFDKLTIEGGLEVEYIIGESNSLAIEADSNLMQNIETNLIEGTLRIKNNTSIRKQISCKLTAPMVKEITISAGAELTSKDTIQTGMLNFTVNAGSSFALTGNFDTLVSAINAGSKATLIGTCKAMEVSVNAGSKLYAFGLITDHLIVEANAGSSALVNSKELEASASAGPQFAIKRAQFLKTLRLRLADQLNRKKETDNNLDRVMQCRDTMLDICRDTKHRVPYYFQTRSIVSLQISRNNFTTTKLGTRNTNSNTNIQRLHITAIGRKRRN